MAGVVTPTPEAVKALLPKLADLPREAEKKAKTEDDLRKEVREAKSRIIELERQAKNAIAPAVNSSKEDKQEIKRLEGMVEQYKTETTKIFERVRFDV